LFTGVRRPRAARRFLQLIDPTSTTANFQTPLLWCDVAVAQRVMMTLASLIN
jgi:hypothetical protein